MTSERTQGPQPDTWQESMFEGHLRSHKEMSSVWHEKQQLLASEERPLPRDRKLLLKFCKKCLETHILLIREVSDHSVGAYSLISPFSPFLRPPPPEVGTPSWVVMAVVGTAGCHSHLPITEPG